MVPASAALPRRAAAAAAARPRGAPPWAPRRAARGRTARGAGGSEAGLAVVTGAGSGIGRALCLALVARGLRVLGVGRRGDALARTRELAAAAAAGGAPAAEVVAADVSSEEGRAAVAAGARRLCAEGHALRCLVHGAAQIGEVAPLEALTPGGLRGALAVNVEAPLFLTQALSGELSRAPRGGRVLSVGSGAAHAPLASCLGYCVSKAALLQLTRCLDEELAPAGVRAASAMPGVVDTEMQQELRSLDFPAAGYFRGLGDNTPRGEWSRAVPPPGDGLDSPENVADFLAWLLLDTEAAEFAGHEWDIMSPADQSQWLAARGA